MNQQLNRYIKLSPQLYIWVLRPHYFTWTVNNTLNTDMHPHIAWVIFTLNLFPMNIFSAGENGHIWQKENLVCIITEWNVLFSGEQWWGSERNNSKCTISLLQCCCMLTLTGKYCLPSVNGVLRSCDHGYIDEMFRHWAFYHD